MNTKKGKELKCKGSHRVGGIVGCVHLNAHDVGRAIVAGKSVWFAWGSNLDPENAERTRDQGFDTIKEEHGNGFASIVIPVDVMRRLMSVIVWESKRDKACLVRQLSKI